MRHRDTGSSDKSGINTFHKMMAVLNCYSIVDRSLSLARIAEATGMPKTTVHRIVTVLGEIGFIQQDPRTGSYALGLRLFQLGSLVLANMDLHREAKPLIEHLTKTTEEAVHLGVFDGNQIVVIERKDRIASAPRTVTELEAAPAYCTGVGKAALAFQETAAIDRVIRAGLKPFTRNTLTDPAALKRDLKRTRQRGFAIDNGEHQIGLRCVAAPIRDGSSKVFASISVTGPADRLPDSRIAVLAEIVVHTAEEISRRLGYKGES